MKPRTQRSRSRAPRPQDDDATPATSGTRGVASAVVHVPFPDRYEDLGLLARGGWGEVRRVRDLTMDRVVVAKILAWEHLESESVRARFLNEARVTASLDHPGIVPILDGGTLPDRRPWFAMKEVAGRTLQAVLADPVEGAEGSTTLRRRIEVLARISEVVGYAHERGVVHRDLKPGNVMIGRFGEVLVLDWGIARLLSDPVPRTQRAPIVDGPETQAGDVLGTVAYMSPEQARGANRDVGPATDAYAIGLLLFEVLTGHRARQGSRVAMWAQASRGDVPSVDAGPDDLRAICARALRVKPADRYPNGMAIAAALREWLEGAARVQRADEAVAHASRLVPEIDSLRERRDVLRAEAARAAADLGDHGSIDRKRDLWALEDRVADLDLEIATSEARRIEALRSALEHDPDHRPAHAELARVHRASLIDAERRNDRIAAAQHELSLRKHDRGENASFLRGVGHVLLDSRPSGASVVAYRWVERDRKLVAEPVGRLGTTPIHAELAAGSYLLELRYAGVEVRYPVVVERDETWPTTRPGDTSPSPVAIPSSLGARETFVPAGFTWVGHDELAAEPVRSQRVWIDDFVIQTFPVTCEEYLTFLDALAARGDESRAWQLAPYLARAASAVPTPAVCRADGRFAMHPDEHGRPIDPESPIASIDWPSAVTYAEWLSVQTGHDWRLPNELEWEKAARGVDRRPFPWGRQPEPTWACILGTSPDAPQRAPVDSFPIDESPYGVRGTAGNVRDWCINAWKPEGPDTRGEILQSDVARSCDEAPRAIRGGAWTSVVAFARCAGRFAAKPHERFAVVGLRLVRDP